MFIRHLKLPGDEWEIVNIARGELVPDLDKYKGIVITGSHFNCRDGPSLPWFEPLREFISRSYTLGSPRIFGVCYGCQIIAHALGGEVDLNPSRRFCLKAEEIVPINKEKIFEICGDVLGGRDHFKIIVSHGDSVLQLPPDSTLLASSSTCTNEIFLVGSTLIACQSHPEFDYDYAIEQRIWPAVCEKNKRLTEIEMAASRITFEGYSRDLGADALMQDIKTFLHADF